MKFIIATNNPSKLVELERILAPMNINAVSPEQEGITLSDVEENGSTFKENSYIKAYAACERTDLPAIADDSGICVDAMDGRPGIFSARFGGENADDKYKNSLILNELEGKTDRGAHYTCAITCVFPNKDIIQVEEYCYGEISLKPEGNGGFGYDPIFKYNGISFGNLSSQEKDKVSHRGKALRAFQKALSDYMEENNA